MVLNRLVDFGNRRKRNLGTLGDDKYIDLEMQRYPFDEKLKMPSSERGNEQTDLDLGISASPTALQWPIIPSRSDARTMEGVQTEGRNSIDEIKRKYFDQFSGTITPEQLG
jgi:hypothetical protein